MKVYPAYLSPKRETRSNVIMLEGDLAGFVVAPLAFVSPAYRFAVCTIKGEWHDPDTVVSIFPFMPGFTYADGNADLHRQVERVIAKVKAGTIQISERDQTR